METEVSARIVDVSGQTAKPRFPDSKPKKEAQAGEDEAAKKDHFPKIIHPQLKLMHGGHHGKHCKSGDRSFG
jgi:hypothetical protein